MTAPHRPYVVGSVAMSLDGYIDDASADRLVLSGPEDLDRVDAVRAGVDAILVGSGTVRADDPRLLVRSSQRHADRSARKLPPSPLRVVLAHHGEGLSAARLFQAGEPPVVYAAADAVARLQRELGPGVPVVAAAGPAEVLDDLARRGVTRLLVEGGTAVHTAFLAADLVDELHVAVAPFFVGDPAAPRFVGPAAFPQASDRRLRLGEVRTLGDVAVLVYRRGDADLPHSEPRVPHSA